MNSKKASGNLDELEPRMNMTSFTQRRTAFITSRSSAMSALVGVNS